MAKKTNKDAVLGFKYDYDFAFVMYCGGSTYDQICAHPKFRGMSRQTLYQRASRDDWEGRKERLARLPQGNAVDLAAKALTDRLKREGIEHQEFMLSELGRERNVFRNRAKSDEDQLERLQILEKIDNLGRKVSKLDEEKPQNPLTQNFAFLVHLQANTQRNGSEASVGILRSNNAHLEAPDTLEIDSIDHVEEVGAPEPTGLKVMPPPGSLFGATPIAPKP